MSKKPKSKPDDPEQSKRFIETAEQVEADDAEALERAFKKIAPPRAPTGPQRGQNQTAVRSLGQKKARKG